MMSCWTLLAVGNRYRSGCPTLRLFPDNQVQADFQLLECDSSLTTKFKPIFNYSNDGGAITGLDWLALEHSYRFPSPS